MKKEDEIPLEYRRYSASLNFNIKSKRLENSDLEADSIIDATPDATIVNKEQPVASPPKMAMPPIIRLRQLQSKLNDNIDELPILNEFIRLGYDLGELELIEEYMRRYLARHSRQNATRYSLAMVLMRLGKREKAAKELRRILQYNPKFHQARQLLDRMRKKEI
jgi:tetratricopeptide (TPR) repeat protein